MTPEYRKVEALLALGRSDEASALIAGLPQREAPDAEYLRLRGRAQRAAGRVFDAEASFREALALRAHDPGLLADLATTLLGQRRPKDALPFAREAAKLRPEVAAYQALLGVVAEALEHSAEARAALEAARQLAPADAETHVVFGFHALRTGDLAAAEAAFRTAVGLDPRRAEPVRGLAHVALRQGRWVDARTSWLEALAVDPRQHDRVLETAMRLGHPAFAPLRAVARVPFVWSAASAAAAVGLVAAAPGEPTATSGAVLLFAVAAVGPVARRMMAGGFGE